MCNFLVETQKIVDSLGGDNNVAYVAMSQDDARGDAFDVCGVGRYPRKICSWENAKKCMNFEYDDGYGCNEIHASIVIVFKNGVWVDRYEYDGSESWSKHTVHVRRHNGILVDTGNPIPLLHGTNNIMVTEIKPRFRDTSDYR